VVAAARTARAADILLAMLVVALSEAAKTTIVYSALWFVLLPALVTGLIVFAVIQARGEKATYEEIRRSRRR
jgi:hypothetical protein